MARDNQVFGFSRLPDGLFTKLPGSLIASRAGFRKKNRNMAVTKVKHQI